MLVYGDRVRRVRSTDLLAEVEVRLKASASLAGVERHAALVAAFIAAAELAQGLADEGFADECVDRERGGATAAMQLATTLARSVITSWQTLGASCHPPPPLEGAPSAELAEGALPAEIDVKTGEGYAFYGVYPETYAEAATLSGLPADTLVIGVRSIGTGLAAMVAAALDAPAPVTVRPVGHPFHRTLSLDPALEARLAASGSVAIVDEGPGLSGSSFAAVRGAVRNGARVVYFPSHGGSPGERAPADARRRWEEAEKAYVSFEQSVLPRLAGWVEDLTGPAMEPVQDISGGAWRSGPEAGWPPVNSWQERRKFRLTSQRGVFLLKFAGFGRMGEEAAAAARAMAGFTPEVLGFRHGFLIERWIEPARQATPSLEQVARYLSRRAHALPAGDADGAALAALTEMAEVNTREALGADAAARLPDLRGFAIRRIWTDNRLHRWEWIVGPAGQVLKTDAVDHARSHDLIGAQDIAWDVAGASVELEVDLQCLAQSVGADPFFAEALAPAYLAFQLGAYAMAADAHPHWPAEQARLAAARNRYCTTLARRLEL